MKRTSYNLRHYFGHLRALLLLSALATVVILVHISPAEAHVTAGGNEFWEQVNHMQQKFNGPYNYNGWQQQFRWWADSSQCQHWVSKTDIGEIPGVPGSKRYVYKFHINTDVNARGHAMEAGAFSDSQASYCWDTQNGSTGWDGVNVDLDNGYYKWNGQKPHTVTIGANAEQENHPGVREVMGDYFHDFNLRTNLTRTHTNSATGGDGAFGRTGDAAGYKINGQTIWCGGLDVGGINGSWQGIGTNIRWPGNYFGNCFGNFLYVPTDNFTTNWGAYAIGAMHDGLAVRCGCSTGDTIPGFSRDANNRANDFNLEVATIKNHDGVGTYNGGIGVPPGFGGSADNASIARGTPFVVSVTEAWVTMTWDPRIPGGNTADIQVTKYGPGQGPNGSGLPLNPFSGRADASTEPGNYGGCILTGSQSNVGCKHTPQPNPFSWDPVTAGSYNMGFAPPSGSSWRIKTICYGTNPAATYTCVNGATDVSGMNVGDNQTLYVDVYYELKPVACETSAAVLVGTNPSSPEPNQAFTLNLPFTSTVDQPFTITITATGGLSGIVVGQTASGTTSGGSGVGAFPNVRGPSAGEFTVRYNVATPAGDLNGCLGKVRIVEKPYLRVYGNDVIAGGNFADSSGNCVVYNPDAAILTFDRQSGGNYSGAGSQLGAHALGQIHNFFSAAMRNGSPSPTPATGLTFGNYGPTGAVTDYGGLSGLSRCVPDYYGTKPTGPLPADVSVLPDNSVLNSHTIPDGTQEVIYVDGDVFIDDRIRFANKTWSTKKHIPTFYLVAKGNIYIDNDVDELDGVYIAQHDASTGTGGVIYTCAAQGGATAFEPVAASDLASDCGTKLTINGAFIAKQVKFLRTEGTLSDSTSNEAASSGNVAEVFDFSPELYLADQPSVFNTLDNSPIDREYDSILNLPPIL